MVVCDDSRRYVFYTTKTLAVGPQGGVRGEGHITGYLWFYNQYLIFLDC
jgi:hypothetical protein